MCWQPQPFAAIICFSVAVNINQLPSHVTNKLVLRLYPLKEASLEKYESTYQNPALSQFPFNRKLILCVSHVSSYGFTNRHKEL